MFESVLTHEQMALAEKLLPHLGSFYLVGGTGLALQLGHRRSLDFDLACYKQIRPFDIERKLLSLGFSIQSVFTATSDEFSVLIEGSRVTFFSFPFDIEHSITWEKGQITLPGIIELGAMKAYALSRRSKWKDYVDLYFLLNFKITLHQLIEKAKEIFSSHFNSKLFREQLCYFEDIDYSETVEYIDYAPKDSEIREFLQGIAVKL